MLMGLIMKRVESQVVQVSHRVLHVAFVLVRYIVAVHAVFGFVHWYIIYTLFPGVLRPSYALSMYVRILYVRACVALNDL